VAVRRSADLRFAGQYHELEVPLPEDTFAPGWERALAEAFLARYRQTYGRELTGLAIEALNWKVIAEGGGAHLALAEEPVVPGDPAAALKGRRPVYFPRPGPGYVDCPVYHRDRLTPGTPVAGPAIVEEREATIVLWPGDAGHVDGYRNLTVRLAEDA
jgi:N-methylhydantoinase A